MTEEEKLIRFFNTPEGYSHFGFYGDTESHTPAETAIALTEDSHG